jgi:hypothetical protein
VELAVLLGDFFQVSRPYGVERLLLRGRGVLGHRRRSERKQNGREK